MGLYLNSRKPHNNYQEIVKSDYFVDKTGLLLSIQWLQKKNFVNILAFWKQK